ncbi:ribose-phosphate diphosphokinase [Wolbachia endosymbiont of Pentidionis agamae]|uniref:ribose-phosphate diphosphokinase n=1 Tax=Wolbachia endosymbiont of Pentidionis agamae TaxID=3110435 RepID=UPI002FCF15F6
MKIMVGSASKELGNALSSKLNIELSPVNMSRFSDGETNIEIARGLHNNEVYILQSISPPVNDNLMELLLIIDAVNRVGAKKITAIIPYYGYSRQDRIIKSGNMSSALSAKLVADLIRVAGVDNIIVIDLHSTQAEGFFDAPVTNLSCFNVFIDSIRTESSVIVAPDIGAISRARSFLKAFEEKKDIKLSHNIVVIDKHREKAGVSHVMNVIGVVVDRDCIIIDDIVDSGGTLCNAASALKDNGAKSVIACITHGVLSGGAVKKINSSVLDELIITDTIFHKFEKNNKIKIISVVDLLSELII